MSDEEKTPQIGDTVHFEDGETINIVEVISKEEDGTWDVTVQADGEEPADVYIVWSVGNSRWEAQGE